MRALLVVLILAFSTAHAARVDIVIPSAGVVQVTDATPPAEGPRIACPPDCTHVTPGPDIDIFDLRVVVPNDPATNDPAWDIVSMDGCRGTSALPADNGKCFLPFSGDVTVSITLRYRPIVALTFTGEVVLPVGDLPVSVNPAPGYQGSGGGYACSAVTPARTRCAAHYSYGQPIRVSTGTSSRATFVSYSGPCAGAGPVCEFPILTDTCLTVEFTSSEPPEFQRTPLDGPGCPTGGGGGGGGGTTTSTVTTSTTTTTTLVPDYLDGLLDDIIDSIPFSGPLRLRALAPGKGRTKASITGSSAPGLAQTAGLGGGGGPVLAKGARKVRGPGEFALILRLTRAGRRLLRQRVPFVATVRVEFRTKTGTSERSRLLSVAP